MLAELKMIRALESQIYRLTRQVGMEIDGEQAVNPEHLKLTENLARRQNRLHRATYDLNNASKTQ